MSIKQYDFYYELRSLPFVKGIWVYGSRARGTENDRSDIDLALLCPGATEEDWRKILEIIESAKTLLRIDCIRFDTLKDEKLKYAILKDKCVLFERKNVEHQWYEIFLDLGEAIERLEEMVNEPKNRVSYVRDAAIQRFEFSIELFWKVLKKMCEEQGVITNSPKSTLQAAYSIKLIEEEDVWLDMMEDRNLTSHAYKQTMAKEIYSHIPEYYRAMVSAYQKLKERYML